jgi:hypothetical protein
VAKIVLEHGAFHELWGPHEITASITGAAVAAALGGT